MSNPVLSDGAAEPVVVPAALAGERLDRAVATITGWSRSEVQALVDADLVLVAGVPARKSRKLEVGEVIELLGHPEATALPGPEEMELELRHVDPDVIVLAKPAGLVVHPGAGHASGTLVHGLLGKFPEIAAVGDPARPGIVHRLDRDTSGLLIVARSPRAYDALVDALAARDIERRYLALVWGEPASPRGVVDAPIGRSQRRRTRMTVRSSGRRSAYRIRGSRVVARCARCPPRVPARDRAYPPDPRAPGRDRPSRRRRRGVRRKSKRHRARAPVLARPCVGVRSSREWRDAAFRRAVAPGADRRLGCAWTGERSGRWKGRRRARRWRRLIRDSGAGLQARATVGLAWSVPCPVRVRSTRSARVTRSRTVRVSSETPTQTSWSTQWPSQWSCSPIDGVASGPSTAATISANVISVRCPGEHVPPADAPLRADQPGAFDREEDLLEVRLGERGALGDLLDRGRPV